ncbi:hypothetical protein EDB82DRAFT_478903 [Fusarium venenatum]|uniref:uncharacterized protein n=1 Tax=Fusarium venenatum TaxID=56646 RepID=UPI001D832CFE|nr:hypothetical protein EDB82DRAFT_478903 [Fusarium venenatum]
MNKAYDSNMPTTEEPHVGTKVSYVIASLGAACLVLLIIMVVASFVNYKRQQILTEGGVERWQVAPGGIVTLQTLDGTSPAEKYKFPQSPKPKSHQDLESLALDSLELW